MATGFVDPTAASTGCAIPLCVPDDCKWNEEDNSCTKNQKSENENKLNINPKAVEILKSITGPVSVVAIVGPYRTGKSYLLSRLISTASYEKCCFQLGHTADPHPMGIWMWDTPIKYRLKNGDQKTILFLDTEGTDAFDAAKKGNTQIFTLSVLLSSLFICDNSMRVVRRGDLDQMT